MEIQQKHLLPTVLFLVASYIVNISMPNLITISLFATSFILFVLVFGKVITS